MSGSAQPTDYFSLARRPGGTGSGLVSLSSPLTSPLPALATPGTPGTPGSLRKKGPSDFIFHETLGDGAYSTVVRATDRETGNEFAAKILDKRHIIKNRKVKFVTVEKAALNLLGGHPFIVKLYYTFQDETSLYFILDLARNGDLVGFLKRLGTFHEDVARWYCAEIVEALEYMHGKGVIHRDIKPEVCSAVPMVCGPPILTCGTPSEYFARRDYACQSNGLWNCQDADIFSGRAWN